MNIRLIAATVSPFILGLLAPFGITGTTTVDELITIVIGGIVTGTLYFVTRKRKE